MRFSRVAAWLLSYSSFASGVASQPGEQWPLHDTGLNKVVQWDHYSLMVNGERLFLWSGELHLWRIPVPEVWADILQKVKAAGFNGIGLYEHWGWHAPNNETLDFESGAHNFAKIFEVAKDLGLYIVYRPGPYSNAEANGGGFPGWLTTGEYGPLRDDDPRYLAAWSRYYEAVVEYVRPYLVTNGGPLILWQLENEYGVQFLNRNLRTPNASAINYMEQLNDKTREWGVDVPFMANNPNMRTRSWSKDYSTVGGEVDVYGLDHYPACWTCNLEQCSPVNGNVEPYTVFDYYTHFMEVSPTQPSFLMEFQGGSYNPWNGPTGGCGENIGASWANMFYRHNLAQKVTAVNIYMLYGGTNWGNLGYPEVGTSYDYSSPIHESRLIGDKYGETKIFGLFMRVARDFTKVDRIGNNTDYTTSPDITATELRNPDTNGAFYVTRHEHSPSSEKSRFRLHVSTSIGNLTIPATGSITLNGIQSKVVVTDFSIGSSGKKLIYSTAETLAVSDLIDRQVIVLWAPTGEAGEILIAGAKEGKFVRGKSCTTKSFTATPDGVIATFAVRSSPTVMEFDNGVQAVIVNRENAYKFWAPTLDSNPLAWENSTILVHGPYLVRGVDIDGDTVHVAGDWNVETRVEIWAPKAVSKANFNGIDLDVSATEYGSLVGVLKQAAASIESVAAQLPRLTDWKTHDGLPEVAADYDDSRWTDANHMTTTSFSPPDTLPVLYADEYGYQAGNLLWRGRFQASAEDLPSAVFLRLIGGKASGWSAYLNGQFLGSWLGDMKLQEGSLTLSFENATINTDSENVIFVIQDTMGKEQREGAIDPRGILNATLITSSGAPGTFSSWKLTGNAGGNHLIDPTRGTYNEGGLHAERLGWHLPGFDDGSWKSGLPGDGFTGTGARFYRTVVPLDLPKNHDISLAFQLHTPTRAKLRALLFVNGYQYGKIIPFFGNQEEFPVPPGILNYHGDNTIGLNVWAMDETGGSVEVSWKVLGVQQSSFDFSFDGEYLKPGWTDRSQYA